MKRIAKPVETNLEKFIELAGLGKVEFKRCHGPADHRGVEPRGVRVTMTQGEHEPVSCWIPAEQWHEIVQGMSGG